MKQPFVIGLLLALLVAPSRADLLNLSGRPLPRSGLDSSTQGSLAKIKNIAEATLALDLVCVVQTPQASHFINS